MDDELKGKLLWCSQQKKGIRIREPNSNLCDAYLKKARNSLKAMALNSGAQLNDWAVDAAYYARYHAVYALLQKCGLESEIHDCSLMLVKFLFRDTIPPELIKELETAKAQRINLVYYTNRLVAEDEIKKNIDSAPRFVLSMEKVISDLTNADEIERLRSRLKNIMV